jgi:hypothetical protein
VMFTSSVLYHFNVPIHGRVHRSILQLLAAFDAFEFHMDTLAGKL